MKFEWENIGIKVRRAKVFKGWILHTWETESQSDEFGNGVALSESMVFIPDPNHEWKIDNE